MTFYEKLIYLINENGITQRQFIKELGLNSSAIQNWRRQNSKPRPETMNMIADYFRVDRKCLENDDMPIARLDPEIMESRLSQKPGLVQRMYSLKAEYEVTEDMLKRLSVFMNVKMTFLINTSEKAFDPNVHELTDRNIKDIDFGTMYDIFELADSCASDDLSRNVMTQISRVVMYRVKSCQSDFAEKAKDEYTYWRENLRIHYDKVKYLLFQPTANTDMNYGFNLSELLHIHRVTGISMVYMLAGVGESFDEYVKE